MKTLSLSKIARTIAAAILVAFTISGCSKNEMGNGGTPSSTGRRQQAEPPASPGFSINGLARYAGGDYSQSITIDEANTMIGSYLSSVSYPAVDTALRSFTFDADTLRAYLQDTSIVTLRFYVAHTPAYAAAPGTISPYQGLNPSALTLVVAGLNEQNAVVKNRHNGVYEHMFACPMNCNGPSAALIQ